MSQQTDHSLKKRNHRLAIILMLTVGGLMLLIDFLMANGSTGQQILAMVGIFGLTIFAVVVGGYAVTCTSSRGMMVAAAMTAAVLWVWTDHGPSRLRFKLAQPQFAAMVDSIQSGAVEPEPAWVGSYSIEKIELKSNGEICFWTDLDTRGNAGIVYSPSDPPQQNISMSIKLAEDWFIVSID